MQDGGKTTQGKKYLKKLSDILRKINVYMCVCVCVISRPIHKENYFQPRSPSPAKLPIRNTQKSQKMYLPAILTENCETALH